MWKIQQEKPKVITRSISLFGGAFLLASAASAADSDVGKCRSITEAAARLACYDRAADQPAAPAEASPAPAVPATSSAAPPPTAPVAARVPAPTRDDRKTVSSGRIAAAQPLRHGYFRLELEDGTAYETTVVGPPPPIGAEVHIRHTLLGTTFFDIKGWSPITVRLSRQ